MMKTTIRRTVLTGAMLGALLISPATGIVARADDETGHSTPGKTGKVADPVEPTFSELIFEALESLGFLLPM